MPVQIFIFSKQENVEENNDRKFTTEAIKLLRTLVNSAFHNQKFNKLNGGQCQWKITLCGVQHSK